MGESPMGSDPGALMAPRRLTLMWITYFTTPGALPALYYNHYVPTTNLTSSDAMTTEDHTFALSLSTPYYKHYERLSPGSSPSVMHHCATASSEAVNAAVTATAQVGSPSVRALPH